ncbi:MAG: amino acid ABC transporter permease [Chloroflexi bacterium]|nr:amino acid ABC transporter permease [Chloroflexota bacterium]
MTHAAPRRSRLRSRGVAVLVATVSTLVVFGVIGWLIVNADGWATVQARFFDSARFDEALPRVFAGLLVNIGIFLIAAVCILVWALVLAVMRSLDDPVFFPIKLFAIIYIDLFRGLPSILIIYVLGFGIPALRLPGLTSDVYVWGIVSLVLVWSAYVAEVYRAGIQSVHPSQAAAARSLGLSGVKTFRYVVLPQAIRRVIPPLLNDMVGLQKDTALVSFLGPVEAFRRAQAMASADFNFTPYLASAMLFLMLTVPMARLVDWLVARDRKRYLAGAR